MDDHKAKDGHFSFRSLLLLLCLLPPPALAMSYVPMSDAGLLNAAEVVVAAHVMQAGEQPGRELDATRYVVAVDRVVKGVVTSPLLDVQAPGAWENARAGALTVPGSPRLVAGERVLLFLAPRADGSYAISNFALGAFHLRGAQGAFALRDLDEAHALGSALGAGAGKVRDSARFTRWLAARAAGVDAPDDYWVAPPPAGAALKFIFNSTPPSRWFEFDSGHSVTFLANERGQAGMTGGGYGEFRKAIDAWNADARSTVIYTYGGTTGANGGLGHIDGVNAILFNDPNNEIAGSFDCANGGVVAIGGFRSSGTSYFGNQLIPAIIEGDVVVQDGAGCFLKGLNASNAVEMFGHELGHTLGLGHPCGDIKLPQPLTDCIANTPGDGALMRPYAHSDGRGAVLGVDDQAALFLLYGNNLIPQLGDPLPPAPDNADGGNPSNSGGTVQSGNSSGGGAFDFWSLCMLLGLAAWQRRRLMPFRLFPALPPAKNNVI